MPIVEFQHGNESKHNEKSIKEYMEKNDNEWCEKWLNLQTF